MDAAAAELATRRSATERAAVRAFDPADAARWETYIESCAEATFFHRVGWREIIEDVFRHRTHYRIAERRGKIVGVLPLAEVKSRLFGHALVSLPFCVYGGPAADDAEAARDLVQAASDLARSLGVDHLELRNRQSICPGWPRQELYVTFRRAISSDSEANLLAIPRKQRAMGSESNRRASRVSATAWTRLASHPPTSALRSRGVLSPIRTYGLSAQSAA